MILYVDLFCEICSQHLSLIGHRDIKTHPGGSCNSHWPEELSLFHERCCLHWDLKCLQQFKLINLFQLFRVTSRILSNQGSHQESQTGTYPELEVSWRRMDGKQGGPELKSSVSDVYLGSWTSASSDVEGVGTYLLFLGVTLAVSYYQQHLLMAHMS